MRPSPTGVSSSRLTVRNLLALPIPKLLVWAARLNKARLNMYIVDYSAIEGPQHWRVHDEEYRVLARVYGPLTITAPVKLVLDERPGKTRGVLTVEGSRLEVAEDSSSASILP